MITVMRLWKDGTISSVGVYSNVYWAWRSITAVPSWFGKRLWIEDEKKPATRPGTIR